MEIDIHLTKEDIDKACWDYATDRIKAAYNQELVEPRYEYKYSESGNLIGLKITFKSIKQEF